MVFDICRAFNAIPRLPVWHFLKVLQFPLDILRALGHLRFVAVSDVQSSILRGDAPGKYCWVPGRVCLKCLRDDFGRLVA